jgi:hypothetical protein
MKNIMKNLVLVSIVLMLSACAKGREESACGVMPVDKVLNIKIGTIDKTFNLWKNDGRSNNNDYCIIEAQNSFSNAELARAIKAFGLNEMIKVSPSSLVGIVCLINKNIFKQPSYLLNNDDILGLLVYYEEGSKLKAKVFEKENALYKEITCLNSEMEWISYNDMETFSHIFFGKGIASVSSIFISDISKIFERKESKDRFRAKLNQYVHKGST